MSTIVLKPIDERKEDNVIPNVFLYLSTLLQNWLINEWECVQASTIEGEEIVALSWLHNGKLVRTQGILLTLDHI